MPNGHHRGGGYPPPGYGAPPPGYGAPPPGPYGYPPPHAYYRRQYNPMAIIAMILGIVGLMMFPYVLGPIALVLGVIAYQQCKRQPHIYEGYEMALVGLVLGVVDTVIGIIYIVLILTLWSMF